MALDKRYFKDFSKGITVKELITVLSEYPEDAEVTVLGDPCFYIHCEKDQTVVIFDDNSLDEDYEEEDLNGD